MSDRNILKIENLEVFYGGIQALHGVSLDVDQGEIIAIIGADVYKRQISKWIRRS